MTIDGKGTTMTTSTIICRCCDAPVDASATDTCPECATPVVPPEWWDYQEQYGTADALQRAHDAGGYGIVFA